MRRDKRLDPGQFEHIGHFLFERQAAQLAIVDLAQQTMKEWPRRLEVDALDVQETAIARVHDDGNATRASALAHQKLYVDAVALLHYQVKICTIGEKILDVVLRDCPREASDSHKRIELRDLACCNGGLGNPDLMHAAAQTIQVRCVEHIEVG